MEHGRGGIDGQEPSEREKRAEPRSETERAANYWETRLRGERRIERPQDPRCEIAVVVPVHRERVDRLEAQVSSLLRQRGIDRAQMEIIYTVNNGLPDGSDRFHRAAEANQRALEWIRNFGLPNVHAIDKSSPGNEIADLNVGRARNRGVAEACVRFHENDRNGLLIQSDADTRFEDPDHLFKLKSMFDQSPDAIGAAGGLVFEWNPDTQDPAERALLKRKIDAFILRTIWQLYAQYLRHPEDPHLDANAMFSGAHMISRSFETAAIGGLEDIGSGEDPRFGESLRAYAAAHGQRVLNLRDELVVVTALRDSDRTGSSFKKDFDAIDLARPDLAPDPRAYALLPEFRAEMEARIRAGFQQPRFWNELLAGPDGQPVVSPELLEILTSYFEKRDLVKIDDPFLLAWKQKAFGEQGVDVIKRIFDLRHPPLAMTEENLLKIEQEVTKTEKGRALAARLRAMPKQLRFAGE